MTLTLAILSSFAAGFIFGCYFMIIGDWLADNPTVGGKWPSKGGLHGKN